MSGDDEPLLKNYAKTDYSGTNLRDAPAPPNAGNELPPIGPDELPPAYTPNTNGNPMVTCRVCQAMIDITEKRDQHVVKCSQCLEATPIRNAPPGKKYVRCPCNCLLICKSSSQRIACPRPNCKRVINLAPSPVTPPVTPALSGMVMINCAHCHDAFLFRVANNNAARCPHCRKVTAVRPHYASGRAILFAVIGVILLSVGIGVTVATYRQAASSGGIYVVYVGAFILALLAFLQSLHYARMKTSSNADSEAQ